MTSWPSGHESRLSSGADREARYNYLKSVFLVDLRPLKTREREKWRSLVLVKKKEVLISQEAVE